MEDRILKFSTSLGKKKEKFNESKNFFPKINNDGSKNLYKKKFGN